MFFQRLVVVGLCAAVLNLGTPAIAQAELISTLQAVESNGRAADLATINGALAREQVRQQFIAHGVDPAEVEARLASLTDSELRTLATQIEQMPAGASFLAVIGVVFVVLLILEMVGVIDIFKKIP